jgi:hypothetical protein
MCAKFLMNPVDVSPLSSFFLLRMAPRKHKPCGFRAHRERRREWPASAQKNGRRAGTSARRACRGPSTLSPPSSSKRTSRPSLPRPIRRHCSLRRSGSRQPTGCGPWQQAPGPWPRCVRDARCPWRLCAAALRLASSGNAPRSCNRRPYQLVFFLCIRRASLT